MNEHRSDDRCFFMSFILNIAHSAGEQTIIISFGQLQISVNFGIPKPFKMRYAISYVSTASEKLTDTEIEKILDFSKNWNNNHNITGILLFSQGNFFQVLEGEKVLLQDLFEKITNDSRHYNVIRIFGKEIDDTNFEGYSAKFISLDSQFRKKDFGRYINQVESLHPAIQSSVKYILNNFSEGIK